MGSQISNHDFAHTHWTSMVDRFFNFPLVQFRSKISYLHIFNHPIQSKGMVFVHSVRLIPGLSGLPATSTGRVPGGLGDSTGFISTTTTAKAMQAEAMGRASSEKNHACGVKVKPKVAQPTALLVQSHRVGGESFLHAIVQGTQLSCKGPCRPVSPHQMLWGSVSNSDVSERHAVDEDTLDVWNKSRQDIAKVCHPDTNVIAIRVSHATCFTLHRGS